MANRRSLVLEGARAASDARESAGIDLIAPVDIYTVAEAIGIRVRFLPVSMEGFYRRGLAAARNAFGVPSSSATCIHVRP